MESYSLATMESKFANIVWQMAPVTTKELIERCGEEFGWKRTTTYTVLKKLIEKGLFQNNDGTVVVCMTREEFYARQSEHYVEQAFDGSLPGFLAAFTSRRKLSDKEIEKIQKIIEESR